MLLMIEALLLISSTLMDHRASAASERIFPRISKDHRASAASERIFPRISKDHRASAASERIFPRISKDHRASAASKWIRISKDLDHDGYGEELILPLDMALDMRAILPLDMALTSVDDLYVGCKKRMSYLVNNSLLEMELSELPDFQKVWADALINHEPPENEMEEYHSVAIYAYTNSLRRQYMVFNNAVRIGKQQYRDRTYQWYSLQFLLTEAIQILKESQTGCKSTYRGTEVDFNTNVLNNNVRFGSFTSSSLNRTEAEEFGKKSCFEITTCEGADLRRYSAFPDESEVLIPPYEVFKVKEIKTRSHQRDLWCETVFVLESIGVRSDLNCDLLRRPVTKSVTYRQRVRMHRFRHIRYSR